LLCNIKPISLKRELQRQIQWEKQCSNSQVCVYVYVCVICKENFSFILCWNLPEGLNTVLNRERSRKQKPHV
jgi:hypothetical protein